MFYICVGLVSREPRRRPLRIHLECYALNNTVWGPINEGRVRTPHFAWVSCEWCWMGDGALSCAENSWELTGIHEWTIEEVEFREKCFAGLEVSTILIMRVELGRHFCSWNQWIALAVNCERYKLPHSSSDNTKQRCRIRNDSEFIVKRLDHVYCNSDTSDNKPELEVNKLPLTYILTNMHSHMISDSDPADFRQCIRPVNFPAMN